jgi:hypothetical protein
VDLTETEIKTILRNTTKIVIAVFRRNVSYIFVFLLPTKCMKIYASIKICSSIFSVNSEDHTKRSAGIVQECAYIWV